MAEEKEPERKKLSLQGNKKLSLGSGQDFIKSNRNNIPGTRSVQVETRRKRIVRDFCFIRISFFFTCIILI